MISDVRELPELNAEARANTPAFRQVPAHISVRVFDGATPPIVVLLDTRNGTRHVDIGLHHCRQETIKIALRQLKRLYEASGAAANE